MTKAASDGAFPLFVGLFVGNSTAVCDGKLMIMKNIAGVSSSTMVKTLYQSRKIAIPAGGKYVSFIYFIRVNVGYEI